MSFKKKNLTNINGVDLDLSGVSIKFERDVDCTMVTINCNSKSIEERIKIIDTFKKIFSYVFQK